MRRTFYIGRKKLEIRDLTPICAALWGFALGAAIARHLQSRAAPGLPSAMSAAGLDPNGPMLQVGVLILVPLVAVLLFRRVPPLPRWSYFLFTIALATAPLSIVCGGRTYHVVIHGLVAVAAILFRNRQPHFSRTDVILVPAALIVFLIWPKRPLDALIGAIVLVLAVRLFFSGWPRGTSTVAATVIYPLFVIAYPLALLGLRTPAHLDFFEDAHDLLPASEMVRGERPYRDIVPVHGLLSDGAIDAAVMATGRDDAGSVLRVRRVISTINVSAVYALTFAATASGEASLLAALFAISLFPSATVWVRTIGALFALAAAVMGVTTQRRRWFVASGVLVVVAFLFGMEFAVYSTIAALLAVTRMRDPAKSLGAFALGIICAAVPMFIVFASFGFARDFVTATFRELLPAGRLYVPGPLAAPDFLRSPATLVRDAMKPESLLPLLWIVATVTSIAMLVGRKRRSDGVWIIGIWIAIAAISFAERRHEYYEFAIAPFVMAALMYVRRHDRRAFVVLAIVAGVLANPLAHIFGLAVPLRTGAAERASGDVPITIVPRGRGAVAPPNVVAGIASAQKFVSTMKPTDTWFDLSNAGSLYYFLDRDCPIRHHQVVFYESAAGQREVIAALERNPNIRAALLSCPGGNTAIDGIANRDRVPLVARYVDEHFRPAFDENGVVFWVRR